MFKKLLIFASCTTMGMLNAVCVQQGPNNFQAAPILTSAVNNNGIITVRGSLNTFKRNAQYIIQFFGNPENRNPITEGADFLGQITITTDCFGNASFSTQLPPTQIDDPFMSATATLVLCDGTLSNTSEFSRNIPIT